MKYVWMATPFIFFLQGRKPPKIRIFQPDQLEAFKIQDIITDIGDLMLKGPKNIE